MTKLNRPAPKQSYAVDMQIGAYGHLTRINLKPEQVETIQMLDKHLQETAQRVRLVVIPDIKDDGALPSVDVVIRHTKQAHIFAPSYDVLVCRWDGNEWESLDDYLLSFTSKNQAERYVNKVLAKLFTISKLDREGF